MTRSAGSAGWVELESSLTVTIYRHTNLSGCQLRGVAADGTEGAWSESASATVSGILASPATATPTSTAIPIRSSRDDAPIPGGGSYRPPPYAPPLVETCRQRSRSGLTFTPTDTNCNWWCWRAVMNGDGGGRGGRVALRVSDGGTRQLARIGGDNLTGTSYTHGDVWRGRLRIRSGR